MKLHPLLLLALAACGYSWPQLPPGDRRDALPARLPVVEDDIDLMTLPVSRPGKKGKGERKRQLPVNEDLDMSAVTLPVSTGARKEARKFLSLDVDVPSLHSSGPGPKHDVGAERRKQTRQSLDEDIEIPSLHSTGPGPERRGTTGGQGAGRKETRRFLNEGIEIRSLHSKHSTGPSSSVRAQRQLPVDEDLDMSAMTLPVSHHERGATSRRETGRNQERQFHNDDIDDIPSLHSTGPGRSRRAAKAKGRLPVDENLDMSTVTLPVSTGTRDLTDADRELGARQLPEEDVDSPGVLSLPVHHSTKPGLFKRAFEVELANRSDVAYYAQLNLGTPPQPVFVQLDTGSFELWVNPDCTVLPERDVTFCEAVGYYDTELSSTSSEAAGNQTLRYGIGAANITYIRDSIGLPGSTSILRDVQFGIATETEDQFAGILGLGYGQGATTTYKTFLDELVAQNLTPTRAFSLGLGSKNDQEGVITFGGVDTAKFAGGLAPVPIIPAEDSPDEVPRYWVQLEGITLSPPGGGGRPGSGPYAGSRTPVFLDSGATLTLLPPDLAGAIARDFGAEAEDENGFYAVDCGLVEMEGSLDFAFEGVTVRVPYREMIRELRNPPSCYLGIVPSEDFTLLGDTFLRSAYVVFDPDDSMTYIAQYESCGSMVRPLTSTDAIPDLYGVCGMTENSVQTSSAPGETTGGGGERGGEEAAGAGRAARPGVWALAVVAAWWVA